jgi:polyisoprenoid-binding protein YceI
MPPLPSRALSLTLRLCVFALILALGNGPVEAATDMYVIDKGHSTLQFKISHLGVSHTYGRFNDFNGTFRYDEANPSGCAVEIDCATESVDSNDEGRDKHLRNEEFFNCEKFPSMTFKSTKVEKSGEEYRVTGDFTLLGVTKPITIRMKKIGEGKDPWGNYRMGFDGSVMIKRSEFGMTAMVPNIGDEVYLTLGIEGIKHDPSKKK